MTTRQSLHRTALKAQGWRFLTAALSPDDQAALARLRARGAVSDQEAVRAALKFTDRRLDSEATTRD